MIETQPQTTQPIPATQPEVTPLLPVTQPDVTPLITLSDAAAAKLSAGAVGSGAPCIDYTAPPLSGSEH